jgi:TusA-related sulfurtransferase
MTGKSHTPEISAENLPDPAADLDITGLTCPMTFVRVRLLLDRLAPGAVATVRLRGAEPHANIPRQLARLGHPVLRFAPDDPDSPSPEAPWRITFRKG